VDKKFKKSLIYISRHLKSSGLGNLILIIAFNYAIAIGKIMYLLTRKYRQEILIRKKK
jgi:hypothetical protein